MIKNLENKMEKMQESINKDLVKSDSKAPVYNAGDPGSILGWEDPLEKEIATHSSILGLPWWLRR